MAFERTKRDATQADAMRCVRLEGKSAEDDGCRWMAMGRHREALTLDGTPTCRLALVGVLCLSAEGHLMSRSRQN